MLHSMNMRHSMKKELIALLSYLQNERNLNPSESADVCAALLAMICVDNHAPDRSIDDARTEIVKLLDGHIIELQGRGRSRYGLADRSS